MRRILFRDDRVGWAWCAQLWSTDDGGVTWGREMPGANVLAWGRSASSGRPWILWETPEDGLHLQELTEAHRTGWTDRGIVPAVWTVSGMLERGALPVAVADERTVLISAVRRESPQSHWYKGWWLTTDGGANWRQVTMPCVSGSIQDQTVAVADKDMLWVNCGGIGAMQGIGKAFYRSEDGGIRWQLMASTSPDESSGQTPVARLPWRAFAYRLFAHGPRFAYAFLHSANRPAITHDGGRSWRFSSLEPCVPFEMIADGTFFDERYGYAVGMGGVARTTDGGLTWECLLYPQTPQRVTP